MPGRFGGRWLAASPRVGDGTVRLGLAACLLALALLGACTSPASADVPTKTDVTFLFDTSGSMEPVLDEAKSEIESVMSELQGSLPDVAFGLAEVRDYPTGDYGEPTDEPWRLDVPITTNAASVDEAVSRLFAAGGADAPEAYGRALWETDTNPNVGWRPGARHLIVLIADEVPHDDNLDEGIPEEFWLEPSPWDTGEELPGSWEIPGTQLGDLTSLDFQSILRSLASDEKPLETVDYKDTGVDYIHYWEYWAGLAGGSAIEASESGTRLAGALTQLVERSAVPCATAAVATPVSPTGGSTVPAVVTPRFLQPGTAIVLTPAGSSGFCTGQAPVLGGSVVTSFEEETSSRLAFRTPPSAAEGLALTSRTGTPGPAQPYGVDNFRYPWGFSIENSAGDGGHQDYYGHLPVTQQDLDAVFSDVGPPGSVSYVWAQYEAEEILKNGLCYGFSLLSRSLYDDAHGGHDALSFASSPDFALNSGNLPYALTESAQGSHALTRALLRAAISQLSPEEQSGWNRVTSLAVAEQQLNAAFHLDRPAVVILRFDGGGHAVLAYDYQKTANGIAIDVVDPNVPWRAGQSPGDYEMLQIDVSASGTWTYNGSFVIGDPFSDHINGASGNLEIVPTPAAPGSLRLWTNSTLPGIQITPGRGATTTAIGYSDRPGHGIPSDVREAGLVDDSPSGRLIVPSGHRLVTITQTSREHSHGPAFVVGGDYLDAVQIAGSTTHETVQTQTGGLSVPVAGNGDMLSVTSIASGVKRTATVTFTGDVRRPSVDVSPDGAVALRTAGGHGSAVMRIATYAPSGTSRLRPERVAIHGKTDVHRHAPAPKRRRRRNHRHKHR
jgi:von Willebrand factor type A domain